MKRNNFFISLLICFGLMFAVSSCRCIEVDIDCTEPVECPPNVIICAETFENTPEMQDTFGLPFGISDVRIEGNYLKMTIFASGCSGSTWIAKLVTDGNIHPANILPIPPPPPLRTLRISFENNEICTAVPHIEFSFNIKCLQVSDINSVWLNILGTEYSVLYEW